MKAAVLEGIDQLVVKEVPDYKVGLGEVLVRVKTCAVCGSDLRIMHSGNPRVKYPQIVGLKSPEKLLKWEMVLNG